MPDPIRFGIIGLGRMGQTRVETITAHPEANAVIGFDVEPGRAESLGLKGADSPDAVLEADVDAVFVCTPNRFTPEIVARALDAGKHVFAEKPPGRTVEDVELILEAERRNRGQALKFGFNHRHHLGIIEAKAIVDSQRYGRVLWARGVYGKGEQPAGINSWRDDPEMSGGGILLDQGIHMLDLLRHFLGDFTDIKSMCTSSFWDSTLEDNAFAIMQTDNGRIGSIHSSFTQWKHLFRLEIGMSDGYVVVDGMPSSTRSYRDELLFHGRRRTGAGFTVGNPPEESMFFNHDPSWKNELGEFISCVQHDLPVMHGTSTDAYEAMRMVHAIYADSKVNV